MRLFRIIATFQAIFLQHALAETASIPPSAVTPIYVGTQTSEGIWRVELNTSTGEVSSPEIAAKLRNPNALTLDRERRFLIATSLNKAVLQGGEKPTVWNTLHTFRIEKDYQLSPVGIQLTGSKSCCHLTPNPKRNHIYNAHFVTGIISSNTYEDNGSVSSPVSIFQNEGSSIHPKRQRQALGHAVMPSPDGEHLYSTDLGTDEVLVFNIDAGTAELSLIQRVKLPPGSGPRHLKFDAEGKQLYVLNELNLTLSKLQRDSVTGELTVESHHPYSTDSVDDFVNGSEVLLTDDGKFLYTAQRDRAEKGRAKISLLSLQDMSIQQEYSIETPVPRHFNISPCGKWLVIAAQRSNKVVVHERNPTTGRMLRKVSEVDIQSPMWITFPAK